jgi:hypothetical protein
MDSPKSSVMKTAELDGCCGHPEWWHGPAGCTAILETGKGRSPYYSYKPGVPLRLSHDYAERICGCIAFRPEREHG